MTDAPIMVRMLHIREAGLCAGGARDWARHYGFDWNRFLTEGVPVEQVEATDDEFGRQVAAVARKEAERE